MRWQKTTTPAIALAMAMAGAPHALAGPELDGQILYGINRDNGTLAKHTFSGSSYENVGTVRLGETPCLDINGAAYIPGFQNIYGFWNDPESGQTRLLYIDSESAKATAVGDPMGNGQVTGATAALISGSPQWLSPTSDSLPLAGTVGINPNNSPDNEFTLVTDTGMTITRDDLHQNAPVGGDGVYYNGGATNIRIKPKGAGTQDTMTLGGQPYEMHNNVTYLFTGNFNVRVYNDHIHQNGKAMGKWHLEVVNGEAAIQDEGEEQAGTGEQWLVFALQNVEASEDDDIDFNIDGDKVVPTEEFAVKVSVLGAAISAGGSYDLPVTTTVEVNGVATEAFGDFDTALGGGDVNDDNNPREYIFPQTFDAGTEVSILGRSWIKTSSRKKGNKEWHWKKYMTVDGSATDSQQLIVLKNGDDAPDIEGFLDQGNVVDFIVDFIDPDTNKIVLDENQAIFLYELGTTNLNSAAADFQDLVVLVTLGRDIDSLADDDDDDSEDNAPSRLIKVDHKTGGHEQIMTLDRVYDSLAWANGHSFYAMTSNELYLINPEEQTETLVDPVSRDDYQGLEFAGQWLMGFDNVTDTLSHINETTGADDDVNLMSVNMSNVGTIVFMPGDDDPSLKPDAFD